jgi:DNA repair protein RecO (recombination protein O)
LELTKYLGFYPNIRHSATSWFDLLEGEFVHSQPPNPNLSGKELANFKAFLGINFDAIHTIKLGNRDRQSLLENLVFYFEVHLQGFKKPRSLAILNEVFN